MAKGTSRSKIGKGYLKVKVGKGYLKVQGWQRVHNSPGFTTKLVFLIGWYIFNVIKCKTGPSLALSLYAKNCQRYQLRCKKWATISASLIFLSLQYFFMKCLLFLIELCSCTFDIKLPLWQVGSFYISQLMLTISK